MIEKIQDFWSNLLSMYYLMDELLKWSNARLIEFLVFDMDFWGC